MFDVGIDFDVVLLSVIDELILIYWYGLMLFWVVDGVFDNLVVFLKLFEICCYIFLVGVGGMYWMYVYML